MFEDGDLLEDGDSKHEAGVTTPPVLSVGPQKPGGRDPNPNPWHPWVCGVLPGRDRH